MTEERVTQLSTQHQTSNIKYNYKTIYYTYTIQYLIHRHYIHISKSKVRKGNIIKVNDKVVVVSQFPSCKQNNKSEKSPNNMKILKTLTFNLNKHISTYYRRL